MWLKGNLLNHQKVSKYCEHGCRMTYINLNLDELRHHLFVVSLHICGRIFNNFDDPCDRLYVANNPENVNIKVRNTITRINKSNFLMKKFHVAVDLH